MSKNTFETIEKLAESIKNNDKKICLYYAFNGVGKTRLSMGLRKLVEEENDIEVAPRVLYYNSFIEDLFIWDNREIDSSTLKIDMGSEFFQLLIDSGKEAEIISKFKEFTLSKLEPVFNLETGEITFRIPRGNEVIENIKISRGEESIFIWSIFIVLLDTALTELSMPIEDRSTERYNNLEYIFIDDPMSSLDDNNIIEVAISLNSLISESTVDNIKYIITTHHALFYNVLYHEIKYDNKKKFEKCIIKNNGKMYEKVGNNDTIFGYHHFIKNELRNAISNNKIERYHFTLFRNLLEKTATYLGYKKWGDLNTYDGVTKEKREEYIRKINLYSHNKISDLENAELKENEKEMLKKLFDNFIHDYKWNEE